MVGTSGNAHTYSSRHRGGGPCLHLHRMPLWQHRSMMLKTADVPLTLIDLTDVEQGDPFHRAVGWERLSGLSIGPILALETGSLLLHKECLSIHSLSKGQNQRDTLVSQSSCSVRHSDQSKRRSDGLEVSSLPCIAEPVPGSRQATLHRFRRRFNDPTSAFVH